MWVGGRTARSLRRAVELADGWAPFGLRPAEIAAMLARTDVDGLEVLLQPEPPLDPIGEPDRTTAAVAELVDAGATAINVRVVHHSPAHYIEQLEALTNLRG
jgi:alkanesulfonate monooxygenase SsuD/methylene tetrahydromethanopterin reductase-like flavin-dependent oxidoreductase (luciferase family)